MDVLGLPLSGLLDSGAVRTVVGRRGWQILKAAGLILHAPRHYRYIVVANSGTAVILGEVSVPFKVGDITRIVDVLYVPELNTPLILGIDFWRRYHLRPDFVSNTCEVGEIAIVRAEESGDESEEEKVEQDDDSVLNPKQKDELDEILTEFGPILDTGKLGCLKGGASLQAEVHQSQPAQAR